MRDGPTYIAAAESKTLSGVITRASVLKRRSAVSGALSGIYKPYAEAASLTAAKHIARTLNDAEESE